MFIILISNYYHWQVTVTVQQTGNINCDVSTEFNVWTRIIQFKETAIFKGTAVMLVFTFFEYIAIISFLSSSGNIRKTDTDARVMEK